MHGISFKNRNGWVVVDERTYVLTVKASGTTMSAPEAYNVAAAKARADGYSVSDVSTGNASSNYPWKSHFWNDYTGFVNDYGIILPYCLYPVFTNYQNGYPYWRQGVHISPDYSIETIPKVDGSTTTRDFRVYSPGSDIHQGDMAFFDISDRTANGGAWGICSCVGTVSSGQLNVVRSGATMYLWVCNNGSGDFCRVETYPWPSGQAGMTSHINYIVASSDVRPSYPSGYGLQLMDSAGGITFDSRSEILPVIGHYKITSAQIADMFEHYGNFVDITLPKALTNGCYVCVPYLNAYSERRRPNADGFVRVRPWIRQINATTIRVSAFAQSTNYTGVQGKEYTHDILLIVARPPSEQ